MPDRLHFTESDEANALIAGDPFALLVGFVLDQQVTVQKAFSGPLAIKERLGAFDAATLADADLDTVFREKPAVHRYPGAMAKRVHDLAVFIRDNYDGDAARVWTDADNAAELRANLEALPGFGEMKVKSMSAVLAKRYNIAIAQELVPWHPTLGDVDSAQALTDYQAAKRIHKAEWTKVQGARLMRVATHPGNFHADDAFAVATLRLAHGDGVEVVRTRDEAVQAAADVRVDVGGRSDPETGDFDHHQKGGAGERPNGIRYASFGLVWRAFGTQVAGSEAAAASIDERLVQGVDANDTGQTIAQALVGDIRAMSVSGVIAGLNPSWDEELTPEQEDARFEEAVALATRILEREVAGAAAYDRARQLVLDAIARAEDPRVIELDRNMPWRDAVLAGAPRGALRHLPQVRWLGTAGGADGAGLLREPPQPARGMGRPAQRRAGRGHGRRRRRLRARRRLLRVGRLARRHHRARATGDGAEASARGLPDGATEQQEAGHGDDHREEEQAGADDAGDREDQRDDGDDRGPTAHGDEREGARLALTTGEIVAHGLSMIGREAYAERRNVNTASTRR